MKARNQRFQFHNELLFAEKNYNQNAIISLFVK